MNRGAEDERKGDGMNTTAVWTGGQDFRIDFPLGESFVLANVPRDARPGPGPSPMEAVEAALAACSGIDVVSIITKMRKNLRSLRIEVEAERRDEVPRVFTRLDLVYHIEGPDLDEDSVVRAVELSQDKYCSVAAMLRPVVAMRSRIILNGKAIRE